MVELDNVFLTDGVNQSREKGIRKLAHDFEKSIEEIEDSGMDKGRFFIHLRNGWDFNIDSFEVRQSESFGTIKDARQGMKRVTLAKQGKRS